jgi:XRE family aerobic/anaerobic benzoate catabolism transcriptional regulator
MPMAPPSQARKVKAERSQPRNQNKEHRNYLQLLGQRVRRARAKRGMSRKILASDSGLSERYLAQLEAGTGNASIIVLRQIAEAMDIPLARLVADTPEQSLDMTLLLQLLNRLDPAQLQEARRLVSERFDQAGTAEKAGRIALIGLRGAGKSTLGSLLAKALGIRFIELDEVIEQDFGAPISEIFALYGQAAFRRHERRSLEATIEAHERAVIATGGGLVAEPASFDLLLSSCVTVWVRTSPEEHMQRVIEQGDHRPMADNSEAMEDLRQILAARDPLYAKADITIDTSGKSAEDSLADLLAALAGRPGG